MEVEGKRCDVQENPSDDEEICLPSDTLQILKDFLAEKAREEETLEENWQLSQFWYDEETISTVAGACKEISTGKDFTIGLFSCPSLFEEVSKAAPNVYLFEYDERFLRKGKNCIFYDYTKGKDTENLRKFHEFFDLVIADPPFLSEECIARTSEILRHVAKSSGKIILCSGTVVTQWAEKYLQLKPCNFQPKHKRNLGNEFSSFANFNLDTFIRNQ
uniref:Protein-lysine N-methyltransferase n=1 Tax=Lutzomyia longipalpis TaxID=7200 RepID=A0A7G3B2K8_LUTLO